MMFETVLAVISQRDMFFFLPKEKIVPLELGSHLRLSFFLTSLSPGFPSSYFKIPLVP
jgi:hypothetical protein